MGQVLTTQTENQDQPATTTNQTTEKEVSQEPIDNTEFYYVEKYVPPEKTMQRIKQFLDTKETMEQKIKYMKERTYMLNGKVGIIPDLISMYEIRKPKDKPKMLFKLEELESEYYYSDKNYFEEQEERTRIKNLLNNNKEYLLYMLNHRKHQFMKLLIPIIERKSSHYYFGIFTDSWKSEMHFENASILVCLILDQIQDMCLGNLNKEKTSKKNILGIKKIWFLEKEDVVKELNKEQLDELYKRTEKALFGVLTRLSIEEMVRIKNHKDVLNIYGKEKDRSGRKRIYDGATSCIKYLTKNNKEKIDEFQNYLENKKPNTITFFFNEKLQLQYYESTYEPQQPQQPQP